MSERVAVLGLFRSGSSVTAAVLHELGVCMGLDLTEYCEPAGLSADLRRWWREPFLVQDASREERVAGLRAWVEGVEQRTGSAVVGAKHPLLCVSANDLVDAWGAATKFVAIMRPLEHSVASVRGLGGRLAVDAAWLQRRLWEAREQFLAGHDHLRVRYRDLLDQPQKEIERMVKYLALQPDGHQVLKAVSLVERRPETPRCLW